MCGQIKDIVRNVQDRQMAASAREEMMSNNNHAVTWQHLHKGTRPDWWFYHSIESFTERPWTFRSWSIIGIIFHIKDKRTLKVGNIWATSKIQHKVKLCFGGEPRNGDFSLLSHELPADIFYSLPFYLSSVINVRRFQPEYFEKVKLEKLKY